MYKSFIISIFYKFTFYTKCISHFPMCYLSYLRSYYSTNLHKSHKRGYLLSKVKPLRNKKFLFCRVGYPEKVIVLQIA